jgi:hypothetical protein
VAAGVFRSSVTFWGGSGGTVPLSQLIDLAFRALADGLPEDSAVRNDSTSPGGRPPRTSPHGNVADRKDDH